MQKAAKKLLSENRLLLLTPKMLGALSGREYAIYLERSRLENMKKENFPADF